MASATTEVTFAREVRVVLIPDGESVPVAEGVRGWVLHSLGGHHTVQLTTGRLVRVDAADGDAIGMEVEEIAEVAPVDLDGDVCLEDIWGALTQIYDPEIPQDIVALGLIYDVAMRPLDRGHHVDVVMTLTAPGCGMGQVLVDDVRRAVSVLPGVAVVEVALTFDPPWTHDRMSEEARLSLGYFF